MNYILTMSLSGSILFLLYQGVRICLGYRLYERWYYRILKVTALYFLIPLPWLKMVYKKFAYMLMDMSLYANKMYYFQEDMVLFIGKNGLFFNDTVKVQMIIFLLWILGTILAGSFLLQNYHKRRKKLSEHILNKQDEQEMQTMQTLLKQNKIKNKVLFQRGKEGNSPFTVGFFKPIIFYDIVSNQDEKEMLLTHELIHIKKKDMFWKFLILLVVAMHWYNPLVWLFKREFLNVCESACDEQVLCNKGKLWRNQYVSLLVKYAIEQKGETLEVGLSRNAKEVEKRMKKIMNNRKKLSTQLSVMLIAILVILNSMTVLAYEDIKIYHSEDVDIEEIHLKGDIEFVPMGEELMWGVPDYVENYVKHYDNQFIDIYGNVYEIQENVEVYQDCEHTYVEGMQELHMEQEGGGCKIYFYHALRCENCGMLKDIVHISTTEYIVCPH